MLQYTRMHALSQLYQAISSATADAPVPDLVDDLMEAMPRRVFTKVYIEPLQPGEFADRPPLMDAAEYTQMTVSVLSSRTGRRRWTPPSSTS